MTDKLLWDSRENTQQRVEAAWYGFFGFELPDRPNSVEPIENGKGSILTYRIDGSRTLRLRIMGDVIQLFERPSGTDVVEGRLVIGDIQRHRSSWPSE